MASVRLSQDLRHTIRRTFEQGFDVREQLLREQHTKDYEACKDTYHSTVLSVLIEKHGLTPTEHARLPDGWVPEHARVNVRSINDVSCTQQFQHALFQPPAKLPGIYGSQWADLKHPDLQPFAELITTYATEYAALREERNGAVREVNRMLDSCTTLRQALEAWPQVKEYVPSYVMDEHNRPADKRSGAYVPPVNVDALNVSAVKNKLVGATAGRK
jgi:hypothetical protein